MKFVENNCWFNLLKPNPELGSEEVTWIRSDYPMYGIWTLYIGLIFDKKEKLIKISPVDSSIVRTSKLGYLMSFLARNI